MTGEDEIKRPMLKLPSDEGWGNESFSGSPSDRRRWRIPERLLRICPPDAVLAAAALVGALAYPPLARRGLILHRCAFRELTGFPCPTCGMTRSLALAVRGKWVSAFRQHFLGPPLLLLIFASMARFLARKKGVSEDGPPMAMLNLKDWEKAASVGLFLVAWVLRVLLYGKDTDQDEAFWGALKGQ